MHIYIGINIVILFDPRMYFKMHVVYISRFSNVHLYRIKAISKYVTKNLKKTFINSKIFLG